MVAMNNRILITSESGEANNSHQLWLYNIIRTQLHSVLPNADIKLGQYNDRFDLVVGFELSQETKNKIDKNKEVYLDLRIHPIRFLDDIFFSFETNSDAISRKLQKYTYDETVAYLHANLITAAAIKAKKNHIVKQNSLLLVGQTERDQVVFNGDKHLSLLDYIKEIKAYASIYNHIYFKPHPYAKNNRYLLHKLGKQLGKIESVHDNIYYLLSDPQIKHIIGLNSSVLYEAHFFGKKRTFLYQPTFTKKQIGIYGNYFENEFWYDILSPVLPVQVSTSSISFQPNRMRKALNDFWGYSEISNDIVFMDILKIKFKRFFSRYVR